MVTPMIDADEFYPTAEMEEVRRSVLHWAFWHYKGDAPAISKPKLRTGPSVLELAEKAVLPAQKSKAKRYVSPTGKRYEPKREKSEKERRYNLEWMAKHRAAKKVPTFCPDCGIGTERTGRCKPCSKARKRAYNQERGKAVNLARGLTGPKATAEMVDIARLIAAVVTRRDTSGISTRGLARIIDMTNAGLRDFLSGRKQPHLQTVDKLCAWLAVDRTEFAR